ncbi:MAG: PDZ domain-containing protein [Pseudomonadota bacterium]
MKLFIMIGLIAGSLMGGPAIAQDTGEEIRAKEIELRAAEEQLRDAEARLAEAAEEVARLSTRIRVDALGARAPRTMVFNASSRPRLGVQLSNRLPNGQRSDEGLVIASVLPGSVADAGGIEAGDMLLEIDDTSLTELSIGQASRTIARLLSEREDGDTLVAKLQRAGEVLEKSLVLDSTLPAGLSGGVQVFTMSPEEGDFHFSFDDAEFMAGLDFENLDEAEIMQFVEGVGDGFWFLHGDTPWGDMELTELNEGLGEYFGVESGLLVIDVPADAKLGFQAGDVIQSIGGRAPKDIGHAMRILGSYEPGETLDVDIVRQKRPQTLAIEIPERERNFRIESLRR